MTKRTNVLRAALVGAFVGAGVAPITATAQETPPAPRVIDIDAVLLGEGFIEIDLNSDRTTDFLVEIIRPPLAFEAVSRTAVESEFGAANFSIPVPDDGRQLTEVALIRSVEDRLDEGRIFTDFSGDDTTNFALEFNDGDFVGGRKANSDTIALLYYETAFVSFEQTQTGGFETVLSGEETFGPFAENGANAFVGLSIFNERAEGVNFGFLEITRGSITVGQQGFQTQPFTTAQIGATVVPLPAPFALLGVAIAGLFGLRRFKA